MPTSDSGRTTGTRKDRRRGSPAGVASGSLSGFIDASHRFWQKSYAGDYLGLSLLAVGYLLLKLSDEPFHQMFTLDDSRIQHPHAAKERVPVLELFIYAALVPFFSLAIYLLAFRGQYHKAHVTLLGMAIAVLSTSFLTDVFKDAVGRPRPDLIDRCKPEDGTPRKELVTWHVCTETDHHLLHDGWRSFPSGHSSFAFAALGWVSFFIASQTHVLRPRASMIAVALSVAPLVAAALIAISRLEDYRHDVADVMIGGLLGFGIALFNWRRYWPSLLAPDCDVPHPPPSVRKLERSESPRGEFIRIRDEEDGPAILGGSSGQRYTVDDER